jgi:AAA family ATP:ADP antiporter
METTFIEKKTSNFWNKVNPIRYDELSKFLLTTLMMVMIIYIYSILRGTKDALVVTSMGAEALSALKLYCVLPASIIMVLTYTKLTDFFVRSQLFHGLNLFFIIFFTFFGIFLYPNADAIHFNLTHLVEEYPRLKYEFLLIGNWSFSLFYILSELWGSIMLTLMFWQVANQICNLDEAKRFYPLIGLLGQIGFLASGILLKHFVEISREHGWGQSIIYICASVLICGLVLSAAFFLLTNKVVGYEAMNGSASKKKKHKLGLINSLKMVFSSKYIGLISLLVLCYGISINLVEGVWKKQLGVYYPNALDYASYMGSVQSYTAIATFIAMACGSIALRALSWRTCALATPVMIFLTGAPFFFFVIFSDYFVNNLNLLSTAVIYYAVLFGGMQNVFSKAVKYSFFDPTKEMAYIPLDDDLKSKGKAAADSIGGRLGKSGGAVIQQALLKIFAGSTLITIAPNLAFIFAFIMVIWFFAVLALNREFTKLSNNA